MRAAISEHTNPANPKPPSVDRLSQLWRRVNEHKMVQWSVAYVALAYGVQHGVTLTTEAFDWPHAMTGISMLLLALGLPVVMTFAWYHGERASRRISGPELTIISLLLVMSSLMFYVFVRPSEPIAAAPSAQQAGVAAARSAAISLKGAISVAVLPFVNLSSDKEQEFFSDGMTEEITAALAKVPDLRVVARTSAFEFKGKNVNIKTMGEELGATHLIEGSVRKAGNRLRITAQLIKADDGSHIWAENYDRELKDVFAVQEDIARAITASLRMPLGLKPGENLVNNRSIDPESHQQYLRAISLVNSRGLQPQNITQASALLEQIVARNPDYAPAWALLSAAYFLTGNARGANDNSPVDELRRVVGELLAKADAAARRAIALDPNLAIGYGAMGLVLWARSKPLEADELFLKGLALDPNDWATLNGRAYRLTVAGHVKEGLAMNEQVRVLEPFLPQPANAHVTILWLNGRNDDAIALAKTLQPANRAPQLARIYASMGRYKDAAEALMEIPQEAANFPAAQIAIRLLRMAPARLAAQDVPRLPQGLDFVYLYVGAPERFMDNLERRVAVGDVSGNVGTYSVWHPGYAAVRKTERFKVYVRAAGLVDYWRAKGWPEFCHPTTGDDFACE